MREERLTAARIVSNEILNNSEVLEVVSDNMKHDLGKGLMEKLEDGNSYVVTLGAERQEPEAWTNSTKFFRKVYAAKLIRCMNYRYTPPVDEEFILSGAVSHLYCNRLGEKVHPQGFCAWAEDRPDHVRRIVPGGDRSE